MSRRAKLRRALALLATGFLLSSCSVLTPKPDFPAAADTASDWPARRAALEALQDFALRGRIAVAGGGEGFNATLRWQQRGQVGQMQLAGPLGLGALTIDLDGASLRVTDAGGKMLADAAARAEIERRLGFTLPLAELSYWVRGVAQPAQAATEQLNAEGTRLSALDQAGWRVDYANQTLSPLGVLPQKLSAQRADYRLRLVIDQWSRP